MDKFNLKNDKKRFSAFVRWIIKSYNKKRGPEVEKEKK